MTDAQPHRPVHRVAVEVIARHPSHLAALITARGRATRRSGGQDNGELLPDFAVAGVEDYVLRIGIDADQPRDLAVNTGFFFRFRTAACTIDSPKSMAPPGTVQFRLSDRRMSKTSPAALVTTTLTDGTGLLAAGAAGSS
jgi:hypothetical protein